MSAQLKYILSATFACLIGCGATSSGESNKLELPPSPPKVFKALPVGYQSKLHNKFIAWRSKLVDFDFFEKVSPPSSPLVPEDKYKGISAYTTYWKIKASNQPADSSSWGALNSDAADYYYRFCFTDDGLQSFENIEENVRDEKTEDYLAELEGRYGKAIRLSQEEYMWRNEHTEYTLHLILGPGVSRTKIFVHRWKYLP